MRVFSPLGLVPPGIILRTVAGGWRKRQLGTLDGGPLVLLGNRRQHVTQHSVNRIDRLRKEKAPPLPRG
jgi:hypothetical protein